MKPKFEHDCENCTFLGHFYDHDVYQCGKSLVARYSSEGSQYWSMPQSLVVDSLGRDGWQEDQGMRAVVAAIFCRNVGELPAEQRKCESIHDVKRAVSKLRWDMLFNPSSDVVPDPAWGLEADTAFQHFYIARSLLEQAEHHLSIAAAHDRVCWEKFRQFRETQETANDGT
jgi:hypothetical protein